MPDDAIDCDYTECPVCPYCGFDGGDPEDMRFNDACEYEAECDRCGRGYIVRCNISPTYTSRKPEPTL